MKSVKLEWCLGEVNNALSLLEEAVKHYPDFPKLWMMWGQIQEQQGNNEGAQSAYNKGVSDWPYQPPVRFEYKGQFFLPLRL